MSRWAFKGGKIERGTRMIELKPNKDIIVDIPTYEITIDGGAALEVKGESIAVSNGQTLVYNGATQGYEIIEPVNDKPNNV